MTNFEFFKNSADWKQHLHSIIQKFIRSWSWYVITLLGESFILVENETWILPGWVIRVQSAWPRHVLLAHLLFEDVFTLGEWNFDYFLADLGHLRGCFVFARTRGILNSLLLLCANNETFCFMLGWLVLTWTWHWSGLVRSEQIVSYFLSAYSDVCCLWVAHIVQGLFILSRSWVIVPLWLVLGAHWCDSLDVVERGGIFGIIAGSRSLVLSLLFPDVLSLSLAYANRRYLLPRRRVVRTVLSWAWIRILFCFILGTHRGNSSRCLTKSVSFTYVISWPW